MSTRSSSRPSSLARALLLLTVLPACPDGPPDDGDAGVDEDTCASFCDLEAECEFRTVEACEAASCEGTSRVPSTADECVAAATDCAAVAECTCAEACAKVDTCTGSVDMMCVSTCETLTTQIPAEKYRENRCLIESACADLALCSGG